MDTDKIESPFYPPRARWWGRLFFLPWFRLEHALHLDKIHLPDGFALHQFILSLFLLGYAFFVQGRRTLGWVFIGVYIFSVSLFIVALGYELGSLGFGLMVSAHASGIIFLEGRWLRSQTRFGFRIALAIATLISVWLAVYWPATSFVQAHWIMPVRMRGNVVIIHRLTPPAQVRQGDWVVFLLPEYYTGEGGVWVQAGFRGGAVLAAAGDKMVFSTNNFSVNGVERPRLPYMPVKGGLVVPEKHWFVWPELAIRPGAVSEEFLSPIMLQMATVSEAQFAGRPFQHWFGRKQKFQYYEPVRQP